MFSLLLALWILVASVEAFSGLASARAPRHHHLILYAGKSAWSVGDNWSSLSNENPVNSAPNSEDIFDEDLARQAAARMEIAPHGPAPSLDDQFISQAVDEVHNHGLFHSPDEDATPLYDTGFETYTQSVSFLDDMGTQISMLVNCNKRPEDLLVSQGRALPPQSEEERNNVTQLVTSTNQGEYKMTDFFQQAVSTMFHAHAKVQEPKDNGDERVEFLDASSVAEWMTQCLGDSETYGKITQHDRRVLATMSSYAPYGTGRLELQDFERLYLTAISAFLHGGTIQAGRDKKMELPTVESIWRDVRNHGILSPVEQERERLANEIRNEFGAASDEETRAKGKHIDTLMDECEILEWTEGSKVSSFVSDPDGTNEPGTKSKSSFEMVQLATDNKTPLRMKDGEFVFIDEESCIGCAMCTTACPSSFLMLESGRARTFKQRREKDVATAIDVCPVNCMHKVGFEELKEMETARDNGDGRSDHRHMGHGHTPLSVAGIDSDANHKSSWYHYLKNKCYSK